MRVGEVRDTEESEWEAKAWKTKDVIYSNITKLMSENMEQITRNTRVRAEWRRLVRCAAWAAAHLYYYRRAVLKMWTNF